MELLIGLASAGFFAFLNRVRGGLFADQIRNALSFHPWPLAAWRHVIDRAMFPVLAGVALIPAAPGWEVALFNVLIMTAAFLAFGNHGQFQDLGTMAVTRPAMLDKIVSWIPSPYWRDVAGLAVTGVVWLVIPAAILMSPALVLFGLCKPLGYMWGHVKGFQWNPGEWLYGAFVGAGIAATALS